MEESHIRPIFEGLSFSARLEKVSQGVVEAFFVTIDRIKKNEDGKYEGIVSAVDEFALDFVEEKVILPDELEWVEKGELVHEDLEEEDVGKKIVSKKVATLIGGATIAGTVASVYIWNHKRKS